MKQLTNEQLAVLERVRSLKSDEEFATVAYAGTGKTTTLTQCAFVRPEAKIIYIAYNKALAEEAKQKFPENTFCMTAHSLAYRAMGVRNLVSREHTFEEISQYLSIDWRFSDSDEFTIKDIGNCVLRTVRTYCQSAASKPLHRHVKLPAYEDQNKLLKEYILAKAAELWGLINAGEVGLEHDWYLKLYERRLHAGSIDPVDADLVFFDEAQDANPVLLSIVRALPNTGSVYVGDPYQKIYAWRGAINALSHIDGEPLVLSQSHRFGPLIAEYANHLLSFHPDPPSVPVRGKRELQTQIASVANNRVQPSAVICRTRASIVRAEISRSSDGARSHVVGGVGAIASILSEMAKFYRGQIDSVDHPELLGIRTWSEFTVKLPEIDDREIVDAANLLGEYGPDEVFQSIERLSDQPNEDEADICLTTAHRAKGREWPVVELSDDIIAPAEMLLADRSKYEAYEAEVNLAYVAATRGKERLILPDNHFVSIGKEEEDSRPSSPIVRARRAAQEIN